MTFYGNRLGVYIDREYWKKLGDSIYNVKDIFPKEAHDKWIEHFTENKN
jgi:hypothetical protein